MSKILVQGVDAIAELTERKAASLSEVSLA